LQGSFVSNVFSFLLKEKGISVDELEKIMEELKKTSGHNAMNEEAIRMIEAMPK
jgi:hypothetical protein|tara:strand:+ start:815 stop:976 length:162 start_codon:yes stop_codon:yes gene_type:complete